MTTRVALIDLPALLADVVRDAFAHDTDVEVRVLPDGTPPTLILAEEPDVVMVGVDDPGRYDSGRILWRRPDLRLFAISPDARQAWVHELSATASPLTEVSGPSLRAAVRRAAIRSRDRRELKTGLPCPRPPDQDRT